MARRELVIIGAIVLLVILLAAYITTRPGAPTETPVTTPTRTPVEGTPTPTPVETPGTPPAVRYAEIDVLRISQRADLSTIDVQAATDAPTLSVFSHVYETLFRIRFDAQGRASFEPWLVESYKQVNDTVWEFKLRPGIKFHDGTPLTARDVKASFERGPKVGGLPRILLGPVKEVQVVDDLTFRIVLRYPFVPLIAHLAHPSTAIIPAKVAELFPDKPIDSTRYIVGTGPYRFVEYVKGERTVLEAFDGYWGKKPTVKRIVWVPVPDDSTRVSYLEAGTVDAITHVPPHMVSTLKAKGFQVIQIPSTRVIYIGINVERIPDVRVRQALNLAIDKNAIVQRILEGAGSVATAPISPAVFGYTKLDPYPYDPARARALIREAGWEGRELVFITPQGRYLRDREIASAVQAYLEAIGLKVRVEVMEWAAYLRRVTTEGNFDLFLLGWSTVTLDADYGLYSLFRTGAPFNRMFYSNPDVDAFLDRAREVADPVLRQQYYALAQQQIWRDAPWLFLHYEDIIVAMRPGIAGVEIQPIERWILTYAVREVRG
ncbi:MAG: ABC transporter substrate-binding protein [Acidilobaceae archaeon]